MPQTNFPLCKKYYAIIFYCILFHCSSIVVEWRNLANRVYLFLDGLVEWKSLANRVYLVQDGLVEWKNLANRVYLVLDGLVEWRNLANRVYLVQDGLVEWKSLAIRVYFVLDGHECSLVCITVMTSCETWNLLLCPLVTDPWLSTPCRHIGRRD